MLINKHTKERYIVILNGEVVVDKKPAKAKTSMPKKL